MEDSPKEQRSAWFAVVGRVAGRGSRVECQSGKVGPAVLDMLLLGVLDVLEFVRVRWLAGWHAGSE